MAPKGIVIDEDVDDLDDLIGQFSPQVKTPKTATTQPQPPTPAVTTPAKAAQPVPAASSSELKAPYAEAPDAFTDEFTKEFAKGMESLLKEIGGEAALGDGEEELATGDVEKDKAFKAAWESLFLDGIGGVDMPADPAPAGSSKADSAPTSAPAGVTDDSFQSRIKMTMDKLKESESTLKTESGSNTDMDSLLAELGKMGEGGEGDEDLQGILETMMSQLMSKEVLYEPLKELHEKFPAYLIDNAAKLSDEDKIRYQLQQECVTRIITVFEDPKYSEEDPEVGLKVVTLMNEMQSHGAPPTEIMGDLPPGMNLGADGLPQLPEGCTLM